MPLYGTHESTIIIRLESFKKNVIHGLILYIHKYASLERKEEHTTPDKDFNSALILHKINLEFIDLTVFLIPFFLTQGTLNVR